MASSEQCRTQVEKLKSISKMFRYLIKRGTACQAKTDGDSQTCKDEKLISNILREKNNEGMNPLSLTAKLCCPEMFKSLINTADTYRFTDTVEGISNIYMYDISELDSAHLSAILTPYLRYSWLIATIFLKNISGLPNFVPY